VEHFSVSFGLDLLPGMYSMPIGVVPKPHSTDFHLVTDHSAGKFALNNYIIKADSTIRLDSLQDFGTNLHAVQAQDGHAPAWLFKSDMSATYRQIPMHPLWQLKQINTFQGLRHVDHNMTFGSHSAPKIWCSFFSLVIWIMIYVFLCADLLHYMDNAWSYETEQALVYYSPYDTFYPHKQVKLMQLYDYLGLPHAKKKQVFGPVLEIIGLYVDPSLMMITMPAMARDSLISAIRAFVDTAISRRCSLLDWQCILGWINWSLNAFPLLRPALQSAYSKISGKNVAHAKIYLNHTVIQDFTWLADTIVVSDGVHLLDTIEWDKSDADLIICNTSM